MKKHDTKAIILKEAIKKIGNYSKYIALCAIGTYLILYPNKSKAQSPETLESEF